LLPSFHHLLSALSGEPPTAKKAIKPGTAVSLAKRRMSHRQTVKPTKQFTLINTLFLIYSTWFLLVKKAT